MAGCGEACSHIAAVLFALDQLTRDGENCEEARTSISVYGTVTSRKKWLRYSRHTGFQSSTTWPKQHKKKVENQTAI